MTIQLAVFPSDLHPSTRSEAPALRSAPGCPVRRTLSFAIDQIVFGVPFGLLNSAALHVPDAVSHVLGGLVATAYFTLLWSRVGGGRTVGMRLLHLKLERLDGGPVSLGRALLRNVGLFASIAVLGLGLVAALFDPDRRTWADRLAGTRVVTTR